MKSRYWIEIHIQHLEIRDYASSITQVSQNRPESIEIVEMID